MRVKRSVRDKSSKGKQSSKGEDGCREDNADSEESSDDKGVGASADGEENEEENNDDASNNEYEVWDGFADDGMENDGVNSDAMHNNERSDDGISHDTTSKCGNEEDSTEDVYGNQLQDTREKTTYLSDQDSTRERAWVGSPGTKGHAEKDTSEIICKDTIDDPSMEETVGRVRSADDMLQRYGLRNKSRTLAPARAQQSRISTEQLDEATAQSNKGDRIINDTTAVRSINEVRETGDQMALGSDEGLINPIHSSCCHLRP